MQGSTSSAKDVLDVTGLRQRFRDTLSNAGLQAIGADMTQRVKKIDGSATVTVSHGSRGMAQVVVQNVQDKDSMIRELKERYGVEAHVDMVRQNMGGARGVKMTRCVVIDVPKSTAGLSVMKVLATQYNFWPIISVILIFFIIMAMSMHHASSAIVE